MHETVQFLEWNGYWLLVGAVPGEASLSAKYLRTCFFSGRAGSLGKFKPARRPRPGPGEFTSARVALALRRKGVQHVRPLVGGLRAWRDRGYPVTSEVRIPTSLVAHV